LLWETKCRIHGSQSLRAIDGRSLGKLPHHGMNAQPSLRRAAKAALLLAADHLDRIAVPVAPLLLHLDEREAAAAPDDQVELVAA